MHVVDNRGCTDNPPVPLRREVRPDWNVVVMTGPGAVMKAVSALRPLVTLRPTPHSGVAVGYFAGPDLLAAATRLYEAEPERFEFVQRLVPIEHVVRYPRDDVTETLCSTLADCGPRVAGKKFYVRCRLRGFESRLESRAVERAIGSYLYELAALTGTPAKVSFDDPDVIVQIEVIGDTVGYAFFDSRAIRSPLVRPR
jgi:tRNA(Ser,Leu) C12 N-acetylase TAN1